MKTLPVITLMTLLLLQVGCSAVPIVLEKSVYLNEAIAEEGRITNIRKVKMKADWQHRFGGALLGVAVGQAVGNETVGVAGAFIGGNIADNKYGKEVDEITIENSAGEQYKVLVGATDFYMQDQVLFKHDNELVIAVSKLK